MEQWMDELVGGWLNGWTVEQISKWRNRIIVLVLRSSTPSFKRSRHFHMFVSHSHWQTFHSRTSRIPLLFLRKNSISFCFLASDAKKHFTWPQNDVAPKVRHWGLHQTHTSLTLPWNSCHRWFVPMSKASHTYWEWDSSSAQIVKQPWKTPATFEAN